MNKHLGSIIIITSMLCWPVVGIITEAAQNNVRAKHPYDFGKPLSEPAVFAEGLISTGDFESHPAFTRDGRTLYFCRPLRGLCNSEERDPRVTLATLAHPALPSDAASRLVDADTRVDSFR